MEVNVQDNQGFEEVILTGRMDAVGANVVEDFFKAFLDERGLEGRMVLVNFKDVDYISSAGLRVFVSAVKKLHPAGSKIALCAMNVQVEEIFIFAGFDTMFPIHRDRDAAVKFLTEA
jgi:anti-anti-sigma factor